ncbi:MAG: hypothetical protein ACPGEG_08980 [Salibacteraceae bacterium]
MIEDQTEKETSIKNIKMRTLNLYFLIALLSFGCLLGHSQNLKELRGQNEKIETYTYLWGDTLHMYLSVSKTTYGLKREQEDGHHIVFYDVNHLDTAMKFTVKRGEFHGDFRYWKQGHVRYKEVYYLKGKKDGYSKEYLRLSSTKDCICEYVNIIRWKKGKKKEAVLIEW